MLNIRFMALVIPITMLLHGGVIMAQQQVKPPILNPSTGLPAANAHRQPTSPPPPPEPGIPVAATMSLQTLTDNLPQALETARQVRSYLQPGHIWIVRTPAGEVEVKAALLYQSTVVGTVQFNPLDGKILPMGFHSHATDILIATEDLRNRLANILKQLIVVPAAEFREPEACWEFPLSLNAMTVAKIKIYYDGVHVVTDEAGAREMNYYSQP